MLGLHQIFKNRLFRRFILTIEAVALYHVLGVIKRILLALILALQHFLGDVVILAVFLLDQVVAAVISIRYLFQTRLLEARVLVYGHRLQQ